MMPPRKTSKTAKKNQPLLTELRSLTKLHTSPDERAEKITALVIKAYEEQEAARSRRRPKPRVRPTKPNGARPSADKVCAAAMPISCLDQPDVREKLRELITLAKEQGYLTFDDMCEALPDSENDPDEMETIVRRLRAMEIDIIELFEVDRHSPGMSSHARFLEEVRRKSPSVMKESPGDYLGFMLSSPPEPALADFTPQEIAAGALADQLSEFTRKCIKSAEWIAEKLGSEPEFEWSGAVVPLCKGMENEIHERMICPLRDAASGATLTDDCKDTDLSKVAKYCAGTSDKAPEMGTFAWFLSTAINSKERRERSQLLQIFFRVVAAMANEGWLLSKNGLVSALGQVTQCRNPATHIGEITNKHYQECRELLLGENGVLWVFIDATRKVRKAIG